MKVLNLILSFFFMFSCLVYAQEPPSPEELKEEEERMRQEREEMERQDLEMLKEIDPEAYKKRLHSIDRSEKINEVVSLYNTKEISESSARSQLLPLVKEEVQEQLEFNDAQIERLEKQINYLRDMRDNPDKLIEKKINRYLGKVSPEPGEEEFF